MTDSQEYLQGKIAGLEVLCSSLVKYFFSLQTEIADHVELRMLAARRFREIAIQLKAIENININTPFGKGFNDALDQFADKAFET